MKLAFSLSESNESEDLKGPETVKFLYESMMLDSGSIKTQQGRGTGSSVYGARTIGYPYGKK